MRRAVRLSLIGAAGVLSVVLFGGFALLVVGQLTGALNTYVIPSSAMEPTLQCARPGPGCMGSTNERVVVRTWFVSYGRGDIVVFDTPEAAKQRCGFGGTFVKRLIGLPGEKLEVRLIRGDGYVFINGRRLKEPYVRPDRRQVPSSFGPVTVPANQYFMLGDNRESSCDSREWGSVPRENLIGKVFATYWPPNRLSLH